MRYNSYADHLNTPRLIADASQQVVWRRDNQEPFGDSPADENPSGLGVFEFDLGFPGQVRNRETGTWYNYKRDCYDSAIGRYCQSDPIGLRGGLNTYNYVFANPLSFVDPLGLQAIPMPTPTPPIAGPNNGSNANIARGLTNLINKIKNFFCSSADDDYEKCVKKCRRDADNANERCYRDYKNDPAAYEECAAGVLADMVICVNKCAADHGR